MNLNFTTIRLNHNIRLRKEYFGGLIYDRDTGNTLEVDKSTYQFLELIKDKSLKVSDAINLLRQNNIIKKYDKSIDRTIQKLLEKKGHTYF